jgi:hypothetical protein
MNNLSSTCYPIRHKSIVPLPNYAIESFDDANQAYIKLMDLKATLLLGANNQLVRLAVQQVVINGMVGHTLVKWQSAIMAHIHAIKDLMNAHYPNDNDPVLIAMLESAKISHDEMTQLYNEHCHAD